MGVTHFSCFYVFGRRVSVRPSSSDPLFHLGLLVSSSPLRLQHISSSSPSAQSPEHTAETGEGNSPKHFHTLQTGRSAAVERRINPKNPFLRLNDLTVSSFDENKSVLNLQT